MAIRVLSNPNAFSVGAQLWVTPAPDQSDWTKKIDWYLNLQIRRAERHVASQLSARLHDILEENELPTYTDVGREDSPLLICCDRQMPVAGVARLKLIHHFDEWMISVKALWKDLGKPQMRIFLPADYGIEDVKPHWRENDEHLLSIVPHSSVLA